MSKYRQRLPQLGGDLFITDGGIETTLVFHEDIELPHFASFVLLNNDESTKVLRRCYDRYLDIARANKVGIVLESSTWRASTDWGDRLGYNADALAAINRKSVNQLLEMREDYETAQTPVVISGNLGPRGDGYRTAEHMNVRQARDYHAVQIATFAQTDADLVSAFTMNYVEEATGIVQAAQMHDMPVVISFTLETDGRLPSGDTLEQAISRTDAETDGYARYYMINCAHPTHFQSVLAEGGGWRERIRGIRANASRRSHAELDECTDLDVGDPFELGRQYRELKSMLPELSVMGGCCGTDHRHVGEICKALLAA